MRFLYSILFFSILVLSCASPEKGYKLHSGSKAYELAERLTKILPGLDPKANKPVIRTDKFEISTGDVLHGLQSRMGKTALQLVGLSETGLRKAIEENAIDLAEKKLILNEAAIAKYTLPQAEFDSVMAAVYKSAGNEQIFKFKLEKAEVPFEGVKDETRTQLTIQNYLDSILDPKINISEEELKELYAQDKFVSVRHLLLRTNNKTEKEKKDIRTRIAGFLAQVKNGEDFEKLILEHSEDPGAKNNKGVYNFGRGKMVPEFEEASFTVPEGEFSDIVTTQYGYHIIEVLSRATDHRPFEEAREDMDIQIFNEKKAALYNEYMENLKKKRNFKILDF